MAEKEKQEALKAYDEWLEKNKVSLNGVKEIRASRDAWLGCWELLKKKTAR